MNEDLTVGKPESVLCRFCLPLFGSIIFQQLYNIADSFVAGKFIGVLAAAILGVGNDNIDIVSVSDISAEDIQLRRPILGENGSIIINIESRRKRGHCRKRKQRKCQEQCKKSFSHNTPPQNRYARPVKAAERPAPRMPNHFQKAPLSSGRSPTSLPV